MQEKDFTTYEYKTVAVKAKDQSKAMDMYEAFGWEITAVTSGAIAGVTLSLKRDRKIKHKQELSKLERQAEDLTATINGLERSKTLGGNIFSYIFGVIATLILGGGMCLVMLIENSVPALIGGIVLGYIWSMIFDGILGHYQTSILLESKYGFWGLIILMCWQQIGYMMIIYIAGLQNVPGDILEAARIDGATSMQTLFRVTIPNVMSSFTICIFLSLTNGFKLFDQNLALTGGQPFLIQQGGTTVKTTEMLALNIYNTFYSSNTTSQGVAQAKAVIFFILVAGLGLLQLSYTRKKEVQQ